MNHVQTHPDPDRLTAFALGRLPEADSAEIESHLADCPGCRTGVEGTADDTLVARLRAAEPGDRAAPNDPATQTPPAARAASDVTTAETPPPRRSIPSCRPSWPGTRATAWTGCSASAAWGRFTGRNTC